MNESEFIEYLKDFMITDYIVTFKMFDDDKHYYFDNELLLVDDDMHYYWDNDWNEGQKYEIIAFIPVGCVTSVTISDNDKSKLIKFFDVLWKTIHETQNTETDFRNGVV